jgi:hypothetical protein
MIEVTERQAASMYARACRAWYGRRAPRARSPAPEVCLRGERACDRAVGRDRPHRDRGIHPPRRRHRITWPVPEELDDATLERKRFAPAEVTATLFMPCLF